MSAGAERPSATLAAVEIELGNHPDDAGAMTNVACLMIRPHFTVPDESGMLPTGERFYRLALTRQKVREILQSLDDDWDDHCRYTGATRYGAIVKERA